MEIPQAIKILQLFNEKADKLRGSRFIQKMRQPTRVQLTSDRLTVVQRVGPGEEEIAAVALTLRFFIQDNEPTSLRKMAELYESLPFKQELARKFSELRTDVNALLDSDSPTPSWLDDRSLTRREIFETLFWGDLAHASKKYRTIFEEWRQCEALLAVLENELCATITHMIREIVNIRNLNIAAIEQLQRIQQSQI
jgi:hypothetical protein